MASRRLLPIVLAAAAGILALSSSADAQRGAPPAPSPAGAQNVAGQFDYYALVLSWSPTYCGLAQNGSDPQCNRRDGRRYAFVLHGLWPQHERGYPEYCVTAERPFVPKGLIDRMQDIMPSPRLTIHEYRKHGTCSGLGPENYYDVTRKLFAQIKIPSRYIDPQAPFMVAPGELMQEFIDANPGLKPDMLAVSCRGSGNRLREVRVCFSRDGQFRSCGHNENQRHLCSAQKMYVPPVRLSTRPPAGQQQPSGARPAGERRI